MDWDAWAKEYPAREVAEAPADHEGPAYRDYIQAVEVADGCESKHQLAFEVVACGGLFYIVAKL